MGHMLTSPLRSVSSLAEASELAAGAFERDELPALAPQFFAAPFGPIAVCRDGSIREAELIGRPDGSTWVVLA